MSKEDKQPVTNETIDNVEDKVEDTIATENTDNQDITDDSENEEPTDADKLSEAMAEIDVWKDKYLRQAAEFDNYRKRTLKEKTELILHGGEQVFSALLPVLDDLDRAVANMEQSDNIETLKEGVNLIIDKLGKTLAAKGLQRMETVGKEFNTDFHEAIAMVPAQEEAQKNHIIDCVQPGYMLHEKVIRHAKVVVAN